MSTGEVMRNYPILAHCATSSFANERSNILHFFLVNPLCDSGQVGQLEGSLKTSLKYLKYCI